VGVMSSFSKDAEGLLHDASAYCSNIYTARRERQQTLLH
jgi:hypothetical protein